MIQRNDNRRPPKPEPPSPPGPPVGFAPISNFLEVSISEPTGITNEPTMTLIGRTLRRLGSGGAKPTINVYVGTRKEWVSFGDMELPTDDRLVCAFTHVVALPEGQTEIRVVSDNGAIIEKIFQVTRLTLVASCDIKVNGLSAAYLPAGGHTVQITTTAELTQAPTLVASIGNLGVFTGGGKVWTASLNIVGGENGPGAFSNAQLVNGAGTGTVIDSGASYTVDTTAPTIQSANFGAGGTVVWHSPDGSITFVIACGESTVGWTGQVDLSAFGQSGSAALSPSGNNMVRTFTPTKADVGPASALNMRVFDRAGNAATNNGVSSGSNMLQTIAYSIPAEVLNFQIGSYDSDPLAGGKTFTNPAWVHVEWGPGWMQAGTLATGWSIINNNAIRLDASYADSVGNNTDGSMCVNVWED